MQAQSYHQLVDTAVQWELVQSDSSEDVWQA